MLIAFTYIIFVIGNGIPLYQAQYSLIMIYNELSLDAKLIFSVSELCEVVLLYLIFTTIIMTLLYFSPFKKKN